MPTNSSPTFAAVVAAGGKGLRFGGGAVSKQFMDLSGLPIYVWPLSALLESNRIEKAVIVAPPDTVQLIEQQVKTYCHKFFGKPVRVVAGGDTRQKSVYEGLKSFIDAPVDFVLIHDAARPFLTLSIVERVIEGVLKHGACTAGIPPADTINLVDGEQIADTLSRDQLLLVQTPQAARFDWLLDAHAQAERGNYATTDDASILSLAGHKVGIVDGAPYNLKITQPDDMILAKALAPIVLADRL